MERSKTIFDNPISAKTQAKAEKHRKKYLRKFGDDRQVHYPLCLEEDPVLTPAFNMQKISTSSKGEPLKADKPIIIGNIRMGYGHYRIAMAIASAARHLGYTPYWFDLSSFPETTGGKVISHLNGLYSLGSRLSQKSALFNRFYWEPLNSQGFRKLDFNAVDQKVAELMTSIFGDLPKDIPFIATHTWTAQAAVHANMQSVINVIPDNWPMALHLAEGAVHTVQTPSCYFGYKTLKGMTKGNAKPMPENSLFDVGHYIDHELLEDLEEDTEKRLHRIRNGKAKRLLLTIGGAGTQYELYKDIILKNAEKIKNGELVIYVNIGDHSKVLNQLNQDLAMIKDEVSYYQNDWTATQNFAEMALNSEDLKGVHVFCDENLFSAVYTTNLLMRSCDLLITKPSELAFYPVPKLMIKRVGGHEAYGALRAAEVGDGTTECTTSAEIHSMLNVLIKDKELLSEMNKNILKAKQHGIYDGAYKVVELAVKK
ncbi:MAG: UDP-N-acetylglucosamine:LPS N-acetylglucosamine transferase [Psychromonas sp.]|jgi:UDP-N-acetylglucosamine:LPS N-acetylglucosamine transferase|uniref:DUF6937 domain-containing protein n=1 Tax=Psychromonas sp. TaxID=1884585 RepID=UPI0039E50A7B